MHRTLLALTFALTLTLLGSVAAAQYNQSAGVSAPAKSERVRMVDDKTGEETFKVVDRKSVDPTIKGDTYGNADGSQYDLAVDGAFTGQTVLLLQFYGDFNGPSQALAQKGFSVVRYTQAPDPKRLAADLQKANQLWIVSDCHNQRLNEEHLKVIKAFFDAGHGLYIWGDNDPCYADANFVASYLFDVKMEGDVPGDQVVTFRSNDSKSGLLRDHLLSTGVERIYEGVTVATVQQNQVLTPFLWGSAGNLIAAFYDRQGKRAILDGGFTRLYYKWDTAGTGRYIANAAAWLANYERFGDTVVAEPYRKQPQR